MIKEVKRDSVPDRREERSNPGVLENIWWLGMMMERENLFDL